MGDLESVLLERRLVFREQAVAPGRGSGGGVGGESVKADSYTG